MKLLEGEKNQKNNYLVKLRVIEQEYKKQSEKDIYKSILKSIPLYRAEEEGRRRGERDEFF